MARTRDQGQTLYTKGLEVLVPAAVVVEVHVPQCKQLISRRKLNEPLDLVYVFKYARWVADTMSWIQSKSVI